MKNFARISLAFVAIAGLAGLAVADDPKNPPTTDKPATMEMPKAPAEIAAILKAMGTSMKCTGTTMAADGKSEIPMKATFKNKLDLDGWWIVTNFAETKKGGFKFTSFTTFDGKKWTRAMVDNMGGREIAESTGMADNKLIWEGQATGAMGAMKSRHTEEVKGPKEVHMFGEYSADGKAWMKAYDITCKK